MTNDVSLRDVREGDLPIFFEHQRDSDATRMAGFRSRDREEFLAHWAKIMVDKSTVVKTVVFRGDVAGNIVIWNLSGELNVGYWIGKEYWGKGIASAAMSQLLAFVKARPLNARVAKHNTASIRVLQKSGFTIAGEEQFTDSDGSVGEEYIFTLEAND